MKLFMSLVLLSFGAATYRLFPQDLVHEWLGRGVLFLTTLDDAGEMTLQILPTTTDHHLLRSELLPTLVSVVPSPGTTHAIATSSHVVPTVQAHHRDDLDADQNASPAPAQESYPSGPSSSSTFMPMWELHTPLDAPSGSSLGRGRGRMNDDDSIMDQAPPPTQVTSRGYSSTSILSMGLRMRNRRSQSPAKAPTHPNASIAATGKSLQRGPIKALTEQVTVETRAPTMAPAAPETDETIINVPGRVPTKAPIKRVSARNKEGIRHLRTPRAPAKKPNNQVMATNPNGVEHRRVPTQPPLIQSTLVDS